MKKILFPIIILFSLFFISPVLAELIITCDKSVYNEIDLVDAYCYIDTTDEVDITVSFPSSVLVDVKLGLLTNSSQTLNITDYSNFLINATCNSGNWSPNAINSSLYDCENATFRHDWNGTHWVDLGYNLNITEVECENVYDTECEYNRPIPSGDHLETQYFNVFEDELVNNLGLNTFKSENLQTTYDKTYFRVYTKVPIGSAGKFSISVESISDTGELDPQWLSGWDKCKNIGLNEGNIADRDFEPIEMMLSGLIFATNNASKEIRIMDEPCGQGGNSVRFQVLATDDSTYAKVVFLADLNKNEKTNYSVYYDNPNASAPIFTPSFSYSQDSRFIYIKLGGTPYMTIGKCIDMCGAPQWGWALTGGIAFAYRNGTMISGNIIDTPTTVKGLASVFMDYSSGWIQILSNTSTQTVKCGDVFCEMRMTAPDRSSKISRHIIERKWYYHGEDILTFFNHSMYVTTPYVSGSGCGVCEQPKIQQYFTQWEMQPDSTHYPWTFFVSNGTDDALVANITKYNAPCPYYNTPVKDNFWGFYMTNSSPSHPISAIFGFVNQSGMPYLFAGNWETAFSWHDKTTFYKGQLNTVGWKNHKVWQLIDNSGDWKSTKDWGNRIENPVSTSLGSEQTAGYPQEFTTFTTGEKNQTKSNNVTTYISASPKVTYTIARFKAKGLSLSPYPLNPKIYVAEKLVWSYLGNYSGDTTIDMNVTRINEWLQTRPSGLIPITIEMDNVGTMYLYDVYLFGISEEPIVFCNWDEYLNPDTNTCEKGTWDISTAKDKNYYFFGLTGSISNWHTDKEFRWERENSSKPISINITFKVPTHILNVYENNARQIAINFTKISAHTKYDIWNSITVRHDLYVNVAGEGTDTFYLIGIPSPRGVYKDMIEYLGWTYTENTKTLVIHDVVMSPHEFYIDFRGEEFKTTLEDIGAGIGSLFSALGSPLAIFIILLSVGSAIGFILVSIGRKVGAKI